jgi:hypothetical protein
MQKISIIIVALLLLFSGAAVDAKTRVAEFKGSGNMTTAIFRVESPWVLDWRLDGDYEQLMGLEITLIEAKTSGVATASNCFIRPACTSCASARRLPAGA